MLVALPLATVKKDIIVMKPGFDMFIICEDFYFIFI